MFQIPTQANDQPYFYEYFTDKLHIAQWAILGGQKVLIFFSNYLPKCDYSWSTDNVR